MKVFCYFVKMLNKILWKFVNTLQILKIFSIFIGMFLQIWLKFRLFKKKNCVGILMKVKWNQEGSLELKFFWRECIDCIFFLHGFEKVFFKKLYFPAGPKRYPSPQRFRCYRFIRIKRCDKAFFPDNFLLKSHAEKKQKPLCIIRRVCSR